jgi:penicillin-binding protein 1C
VRVLTFGLIALLAAQLVLIGLDAAFPPDLAKAARSSPVALDRRGAWLRALPVEQGRWRIRADLDRTDPSFLRRVVALEDGRFWLPASTRFRPCAPPSPPRCTAASPRVPRR